MPTPQSLFKLLNKTLPKSPQYGNIRFIKNLGGLPHVEDGLAWIAPKKQYFANVTTDLPFRLHGSYGPMPGGEYMVIDPRAFAGKKPFTLDPMDTIFKNSEVRVSPEFITIVSGNPTMLRQAKLQGFNVAMTPELHDAYRGIVREINIPGQAGKNTIRLNKGTFGEATGAAAYRRAADNYFTQIGRPTYQDYLQLERATGLPSHTIPFSKMQADFNAGKAGVTWTNMSQPAFRYPDGFEITGTKILTTELPDFYKHVGYTPTPFTEVDFLNRAGGGFSIPHPKVTDVNPQAELNFLNWREMNVPGTLKKGGKLKWINTKKDQQ